MIQPLDAVRSVTAQWHAARDIRDEIRQELHEAIEGAREAYERWAETVRAAMEDGVPRRDIATAAEVTVARLYQL